MPRRTQHKDLEFEIHVDPSCMSTEFDERLPAMEHNEPVEALDVIEKGPEIQGQDDEDLSTVGTEHMQPTVEDDYEDLVDEESYISNRTAEDQVDDDVDDDNNTQASESRRESTLSVEDGDVKRWPSKRTEALIHAAARDIINHVATRPRDSLHSVTATEDDSIIDESYTESPRQSIGADSIADSHASESHASDDERDHDATGDEGGDSSSQHENEDDVFSDNSPRSSMGSMPEAERDKADDNNMSIHRKTRSVRYSDIPQSDQDEDFVPTTRSTPRPAFRSPSHFQEAQIASPPASAMGSPRSSRRVTRPTISRLGSPSVSAQYSPKKTPPRFKRNTPPLVLLHVTLLPLRWPWGAVLDNAAVNDLSPEGQTLWESWKHLQDRTGDTISDRGILLPHPQNDYEILEERLLETLELPLRRRARILECGHYLGPSNELTLQDDIESEDEYYYDENQSPRQSTTPKTHWCRTCKSDIKLDSLGAGKIFRVKVYASNGLMRAGAWEACWKEMERVDVEIEPVVDAKLQDELNHLAAVQEQAMEVRDAEADAVEGDEHEFDAEDDAKRQYMPTEMDTSPQSEGRRARDEERFREIYGHSPQDYPDKSSAAAPRESDFYPQQTPPSPSVEALERREERRQPYKSASLPELILEALRVLMQDKKNAMIAALSVLILMLAVRGSPPPEQTNVLPIVKVADEALQASFETSAADAEPVWATMSSVHDHAPTEAVDPCIPCSSALDEMQQSLQNMPTSTVEVVETITETMTMFETLTVEANPTEAPISPNTASDEVVLDQSEVGEVIDQIIEL